jgi:putative molybdopterin biosynthesis protein
MLGDSPALRQCGLEATLTIVGSGNPKQLHGVADLARSSVRFVSRQPGSGTRLLIDELLGQAGVSPSSVTGMQDSEESHLAVAAAVACGAADAGTGIESAAQAFGLGFLPLAHERYAFVCLKPSLGHPAVQALREVLASPAWAERLSTLTGYRLDAPGEVLRLTQALPWWDEVVGLPRRRPVQAS